jgi:DNA-binding transcriptional ArsR family regulator
LGTAALRVLREAGLVRDKLRGRERVYRIELGALTEIEAFLQELRATATDRWNRRFMALETEVYRVRRERTRANASTRTQRAPKQACNRKKEKTA